MWAPFGKSSATRMKPTRHALVLSFDSCPRVLRGVAERCVQSVVAVVVECKEVRVVTFVLSKLDAKDFLDALERTAFPASCVFFLLRACAPPLFRAAPSP